MGLVFEKEMGETKVSMVGMYGKHSLNEHLPRIQDAGLRMERIRARVNAVANGVVAQDDAGWVEWQRANALFDVYLSGPMTGYENDNHEPFCELAAELRAKGLVVFNPAESFSGNKRLPRETYMWLDFIALLFSKSICLLPGWSDSSGAMAELEVAEQIGLEVAFGGRRGKELPAPGCLGKHDGDGEEMASIEAAFDPEPDMVCGGFHFGEPSTEAPTAARDNSRKPPIDYIFSWPHALVALAEVCRVGGAKYARGNYLKSGKPLSEYAGCASRHLMKLLNGELFEVDEKTGLEIPHDGAAIWNLLCYSQFLRDGTGIDDRMTRPGVRLPTW